MKASYKKVVVFFILVGFQIKYVDVLIINVYCIEMSTDKTLRKQFLNGCSPLGLCIPLKVYILWV